MRGLVPVLGAAALAAGCSSPANRTPATEDTRVTPLPVVRVSEDAVPATLEAGGIVRARVTASVASRVLAPVVDVRVRAGDRVQPGQVLVTLDGRELASRADAAVAALRSAEEGVRAAAAAVDTAAAEQKLAAATFTRINGLHARRSATPQELDQATAALSAADSRLAGAGASAAAAAAARDAARAAADAARVAGSYAVVTAPFAGTVAARLVEPGAMAAPGVPLLTIEDTNNLQVEATLDEARAARVPAGAAVEVQAGPDDDHWLATRVVEVARTAPTSHQFVVKASLPPGSQARTGAFARLRAQGPVRSVLSIPASSVVQRGQMAFVFVADADGRARLRSVSVGRAIDGRLEVLAGLSRGEPVIETPPPDLIDGRRVAAGATAPRTGASQ